MDSQVLGAAIAIAIATCMRSYCSRHPITRRLWALRSPSSPMSPLEEPTRTRTRSVFLGAALTVVAQPVGLEALPCSQVLGAAITIVTQPVARKLAPVERISQFVVAVIAIVAGTRDAEMLRRRIQLAGFEAL
jgi:hypothetical protein